MAQLLKCLSHKQENLSLDSLVMVAFMSVLGWGGVFGR